MENFLDQIILNEIEKDTNVINLSTKVKSFLDMKSSLLKENPLEWLLNSHRKELSICPFSKKLFTIETTINDEYKFRTTLKVDNELIFEETLSKPDVDRFKNLAESLR
jgi:hypothetical protein